MQPFALTSRYTTPSTSPKGDYLSVSILLLGSLGIGKRCFEIRSNSYFLNPFLDGLLISPEISKVSFELLKGFSVTAEKCSSKVCFELLKTFRVTPRKPCRLVAPPKSGDLFQTCGNRVLFLVSDTILFYLTVQRGASDAEQLSSQRVVAIRLLQSTDYLLLFHLFVFQRQ